MKKQLQQSIIGLLNNPAKPEQLEVTRVVRKVKMIYSLKEDEDERWALIIRTDSNSEAKNMEFFSLVNSITVDTYPEIRPGMTVMLRYYREDVFVKKGNISVQADEIWIEKKRKPKGDKRKVEPYHYPEKESNRTYYAFKGEMPEKSKNDEMYLFKEKWMRL
jgi:hypothetical protein